jgi:hypothetical protein
MPPDIDGSKGLGAAGSAMTPASVGVFDPEPSPLTSWAEVLVVVVVVWKGTAGVDRVREGINLSSSSWSQMLETGCPCMSSLSSPATATSTWPMVGVWRGLVRGVESVVPVSLEGELMLLRVLELLGTGLGA